MDTKPIVNGPYLLAPTAEAITVAWEMERPAELQVIWYQAGQEVGRVSARYAREPACPAREEGYCLYTAVLTGLDSGTAYEYEIAAAGSRLAASSFRTLSEAPEKIRLVTLSDSHLFYTEKAFGAMVEKSKPEPDIYLKACEVVGVLPENAMGIEDSFNGIRAVAAAGMTAVMVPDMVQPDEEIRQIYDYCVQDLLEVKELIELNGI